jgi:hypothetical protein
VISGGAIGRTGDHEIESVVRGRGIIGIMRIYLGSDHAGYDL